MVGARFDRSLLSPQVAEGVALHYLADEAFHSLPVFRRGSGQIRDGLLGAGVSRGPARAVGHAGYELLLDGCVLSRPGVEAEFAEMLARAPDVAEAISDGDPDRFRELVRIMTDERWWLGYKVPQMVAQGLQRRLRDRRLLHFSDRELPAVTSVLIEAQPAVEAESDDIIVTIANALRRR
jgi:hypothetical protein